jgi:hypothetical protein
MKKIYFTARNNMIHLINVFTSKKELVKFHSKNLNSEVEEQNLKNILKNLQLSSSCFFY